MQVVTEYNPEKDVAILGGKGDYVTLSEGSYGIFFPEDAHQPKVAPDNIPGPVKKVVIKEMCIRDRSIAFEVGMPNAGLASGLAITIGNIATIGLAPAIYGPLMNVSGSTLASWWRTKPIKSEDENPEKKK